MNCGRIVGDGRVEAGGQLRLDAGNHAADAVDHGQRVGLRRAVDADEHRLRSVEGRGRIGVLRPELDLGDVAEPHQRVAVRRDHQLAERLGVVERGQRVDADLGVVALHLAGGGDEVVGDERVADVVGGDAARRHLDRVEPDAHGEGLAAENLRVGDAVDRLQLRLDDADEIVGDLRRGHHRRIERQVHQRGALPGLLDDDRIVGVLRQHAAHLVDLRQRVGHRPVGIGVEAQVQGDGRDVLLRGRRQRVDAVGARHRLLDRRGDEALDDVGVGAGIGRGDGDRRVRRQWKLADLQLQPGDAADQQDQQADDGRQHRPANEEIGESVHRLGRHGFGVSAGGGRAPPWSIVTGEFGCSLIWPAITTFSPTFTPVEDGDPLAARRADPDEAPLDDETVARLGRHDDEDVVAVEAVDDRGARQASARRSARRW